MIEIGILS